MKEFMEPFTMVLKFAMKENISIGGHTFSFFQLWTFCLIVGCVAWLFNKLVD